MSGDRVCLAGYTLHLECVRPELRHGHFTESWLYLGGRAVVRPFATIEVDRQQHTPEPPHTEDWLIAPGPPVPRGMLKPAEQRKLLEAILDDDVPSIFDARVHNQDGRWVAAGEGVRSLGTVKARVWDVFHQSRPGGKWEYRLRFTDASGDGYRLSVTDLAFRYFVDRQREAGRISGLGAADAVTHILKNAGVVYLRIGLARHWDLHPDRCYLQINGVYTFPDYLDGRCFADFAPSARATPRPGPTPRPPRVARDVDELPF